MNAKAIVPLIAGLGIAGVAAKLGFDYVKKAQGAPTKTVQLWSVVEDVPRGTAITEQALAPLNFPANLAPKSAVADRSKLLGRVPHTGVPAGVPILEGMLLAPGTKTGIHVPPGHRAVAVKIDESSGVDNHLQPGARVDVVGYFTIKTKGWAETRARTLIENVEVAAVGQNISPEAPAKSDAKDKSKGNREKPARAATLLVRPEQVPVLLLAEQRGKIKLSMRGTDGAEDTVANRQVDEHQVLGTEPPVDPAKQAAKDPGLSGMISGLFGGDKDAPPSDPTPPAPVEPPPPPAPKYVAMMTIYQGPEKRVLGWIEGHSDAVELTGDSESNIFQDGGSKKRGGKSGAPTKPITVGSASGESPGGSGPSGSSPNPSNEPKPGEGPATDQPSTPEPASPAKDEPQVPSGDNERPVGSRSGTVPGGTTPAPEPDQDSDSDNQPEEQTE